MDVIDKFSTVVISTSAYEARFYGKGIIDNCRDIIFLFFDDHEASSNFQCLRLIRLGIVLDMSMNALTFMLQHE